MSSFREEIHGRETGTWKVADPEAHGKEVRSMFARTARGSIRRRSIQMSLFASMATRIFASSG